MKVPSLLGEQCVARELLVRVLNDQGKGWPLWAPLGCGQFPGHASADTVCFPTEGCERKKVLVSQVIVSETPQNASGVTEKVGGLRVDSESYKKKRSLNYNLQIGFHLKSGVGVRLGNRKSFYNIST